MKKVIIEQSWGGLGDNLQLSTLPELLSGHGYEVYVSTNNAYRNPEIKSLVWDKNPFVSGIVDPNDDFVLSVGSASNLGNPNEQFYPGWRGTIVDAWEEYVTEILLGEPIRTNGFAKVYHEASKESKIEGDYIYADLTAFATRGDYCYEKYWDVILSRHPENKIIVPVMSKLPDYIPSVPDNASDRYEIVVINSIFDYIDIMAHAKHFYNVFSGMNTLSPLYNKNVTTFMPNSYLRERSGEWTGMFSSGMNFYNRLSEEQRKTDIKRLSEFTCDYIFPNIEYYGWWEHE